MVSSLRPASAEEDLKLAERCVAGERAAQRILFHRERRLVHATLYRVLGANEEMEDLVQTAFLEIFRSLRNYRGEASLATWVDRCTVRVAYRYLSRRKPSSSPIDPLFEVAEDVPSIEERTISRQAMRRLYAILDRIDPVHRLAFALHAIDGRPMEEVARIMEASLPATKARVWRARQELERRARRDRLLADLLEIERDPDDGAET